MKNNRIATDHIRNNQVKRAPLSETYAGAGKFNRAPLYPFREEEEKTEPTKGWVEIQDGSFANRELSLEVWQSPGESTWTISDKDGQGVIDSGFPTAQSAMAAAEDMDLEPAGSGEGVRLLKEAQNKLSEAVYLLTQAAQTGEVNKGLLEAYTIPWIEKFMSNSSYQPGAIGALIEDAGGQSDY